MTSLPFGGRGPHAAFADCQDRLARERQTESSASDQGRSIPDKAGGETTESESESSGAPSTDESTLSSFVPAEAAKPAGAKRDGGDLAMTGLANLTPAGHETTSSAFTSPGEILDPLHWRLYQPNAPPCR